MSGKQWSDEVVETIKELREQDKRLSQRTSSPAWSQRLMTEMRQAQGGVTGGGQVIPGPPWAAENETARQPSIRPSLLNEVQKPYPIGLAALQESWAKDRSENDLPAVVLPIPGPHPYRGAGRASEPEVDFWRALWTRAKALLS
jgi:hypothetical protein